MGFLSRSRRATVWGFLVVAGVGACGSPRSPSSGLTGFGATTATWNAHHRSGASVAYANVTPQGGHVVEYTVKTSTTTIAAAIKRAEQQLPADSREVWSARKGSCYQIQLTSRVVAHALSALATGDPGGGVLAMISTLLPNGTTAYRPSGVNEIMLSPGTYSSAADAPDC